MKDQKEKKKAYATYSGPESLSVPPSPEICYGLLPVGTAARLL